QCAGFLFTGRHISRKLHLRSWEQRHIDIRKKAISLIVIVHLTIDYVVTAVAVPPLCDCRIPSAADGSAWPLGQVNGRPDMVPCDIEGWDGAVGLADSPADRQIGVVLSDPQTPLRRPQLHHAWIAIIEDGASEIGATPLGNA